MAWISAIIGAIFLLFSAGVAAADPPPAPPGQTWGFNPALSDDFRSQRLDQSKWRPEPPDDPIYKGWRGPAPGFFAPENVEVRNGMLELHATTTVASMSDIKGEPTVTRWLKTACASSRRPIALYGYYEARIRGSSLPTLSSFWFQNGSSEIDVQEGLGMAKRGQPGMIMASATHYFATGHPGSGANDYQTPQTHVRMVTPTNDWHIYGLWWQSPTIVIFYLDGREVGRQTPKAPFTTPMYMFFDIEQHKFRLPDIDELNDPSKNTMYVNWVRSYTLVPKT